MKNSLDTATRSHRFDEATKNTEPFAGTVLQHFAPQTSKRHQ